MKLIKGDALKLIKSVKDNSIDLILTDPPYDDVSNINTPRLTDMQKKKLSEEFYRVLKSTGSIVIFCGFTDKFKWYNFLSEKMIFKRELVLVYQPGRKPNRNFISSHESALFFVKSEKYYWSNHEPPDSTVYIANRARGNMKGKGLDYRGSGTDKLWTTPKPLRFISALVRRLCPRGGVVLDPFMGSGTTGVASISQGKDFIGFEIDDRIFEFAKSRILEQKTLWGW